MPRYARFFRPAQDDATHQKQLDSFVALGTDQQNFVLGSLLYDANSALATLRREVREFQAENTKLAQRTSNALEQIEQLGELLNDGDGADRPPLTRSEDEEVIDVGEEDEDIGDDEQLAEEVQKGGE